MKKLTAQEVLEQEGFIPFFSDYDRKPGDVVQTDGGSAVPKGTTLVISGELTRQEVIDLGDRIGWPRPPLGSFRRFYKAVAE